MEMLKRWGAYALPAIALCGDFVKGLPATALGMSVIVGVALTRPALAQEGLPDGPGKDEVVADCSNCHAPDRVLGRRMSAGQWSYTVTSMINLGAQVSDFGKVVSYLAANFGPPAPTPAPAATMTLDTPAVASEIFVAPNASGPNSETPYGYVEK